VVPTTEPPSGNRQLTEGDTLSSGSHRAEPHLPPIAGGAARLGSSVVEPTIYRATGGTEAVLALAGAWHQRCLADPILAHPFEGGVHPQHTERLAAYWSEQLGGPATYTGSIGDHSHVVRLHSGNGPHEQMDGRAVAAFVLAVDDAHIPPDPRRRFQLIAWFTWATALLNHRWASPGEVPSELALPLRGWDGVEGL
jgi:truncated hemoglobin YjbI